MPHRRAIDWTLDDFHTVLASSEPENLMLEYKSSLAIADWTDSKRNELSKDVSAFANSAGGLIIIGIGEIEHRPAVIDDGVDTRVASKEAIESALRARVSPRLENLTIKEIPNLAAPGFSYFVFGISRSMRAPHMCVPFHRYYKRYNFESVPMEHYEVEDVQRRQSEPLLTLTCQLRPAGEPLTDGRQPVHLVIGVLNEGAIIAHDVLVRLYVPRQWVGEVTWSPNDSHCLTTYNGVEVYRFDAYLRDGAGTIPLFPKDDQPYLITRGKSRRILLFLPSIPLSDALPSLLGQVFADNMRMRSFEFQLADLLI
jgi:hypothetical protein